MVLRSILARLIAVLCFQAIETAQGSTQVDASVDRQESIFAQYSTSERTDASRQNFGIDTFAQHVATLDALKKMRQEMILIDMAGMPDEEQVSRAVFIDRLDTRIRDEELKFYEMPLATGEGVHRDIADLPSSFKFDGPDAYEKYARALQEVPKTLHTVEDLARRGIDDGIVPAPYLLTKVVAQCREIVNENPFLAPLSEFPTAMSPADQSKARDRIERIVSEEVLPAYRNFIDFVQTEYIPSARNGIGMSALSNGKALYQAAIKDETTTDLTADQIHEIGVREVARIESLLTDVAHRAGYTDLKTYRQALAVDPRYRAQSVQEIVDDFSRYVAGMEVSLPQLFHDYPKVAPIVVPGSLTQAGYGTHHVSGPDDGSAPGKVVVAVADFQHRSLISDETQAYHEGIPGHELQVSIQHRLKGLPEFRKNLLHTAYAEGWAVYAEALGKEVGYFKDPASDYGRLNLELMRAVRLVVDTGINDRGWSREQAVAYFRDSGAADEPTLQSEIDRYVNWPAQSLGYKIGQMKILELRERARSALGPRFDIRSFHDNILNAGSLPLDLLEQRTNTWISAQKDLAS